MLKLTTNDISLSQSAQDKFSAIKAIAANLTDKGLVEQGYVEGMLNRENQNSTFLGNGIAIPHGTTDTRSMVKTTGVAVHHFPEGVDWGDGNQAYVAIGIAAKSDEHLDILKQLTKVLSADGIQERLRDAKDADEIIALLNGEVQLEAELGASTIQLGFPATDMVQLSAVAAGLIKNSDCVSSEFVADIVTKAPTSLGNGLWMVGSDKGVSRTAVSFVSAASEFEFDGQPVKGLITLAACNSAHSKIVSNISKLVFDGAQTKLLNGDVSSIVSQLTGAETEAAAEDGNSAIFKIKNAHGLHARPGAMLVAECKKFESNIRVANLDGDGKVVNAKSLMKVIALGVKHGHQLQFTAEGSDAAEALASIGKAIESGLGEG